MQSGRSAPMHRIDPLGFAGLFGAGDIEIDDDWVLSAAHDNSLDRFIGAGIEFLMRDKGWNVDEIARTRLGHKLQSRAPAKSRSSLYYEKHGFDFAMMVGAGSGVGLHDHRSRPQLLRTRGGGSNCSRARHARSLRRIQIEFARAHDSDAVLLPIRFHVPFQDSRV